MKDKKNIDRIFQEKFKDFEAEPSNKIWDRIAMRLDEKENTKRPVIVPLWLKLGGIAAMIGLVVASVMYLHNNQVLPSNSPSIVDRESKSSPEQEKISTGRISESDEGFSTRKNSTSQDFKSYEPKSTGNTSGDQGALKSQENTKNSYPERLATNYSKKKKTRNLQGKKDKIYSIVPGHMDHGVNNDLASLNFNHSISNLVSENLVQNKVILPDNQLNQLALLEKKMKLEENSEKESSSKENWKLRVSTFAAPMLYKNLGGGNEISSQLAGNPSSSEVNISYGLKVAYQLSDKIKLRTGLSKLNMSQTTGGISYSPAIAGSNLENLSASQLNVQIRSTSRTDGAVFESLNPTSLSNSIYTPGKIAQQIGFVEVPVEIEYSLISDRFSLNLIGGGSSLFLDNNKVELVSGNSNTSLGKARNINNTSFSTNLGLGVDYQLNHLLSISLEPIFKYQINTFNNVDNVRPANFGIYSGLNLKF